MGFKVTYGHCAMNQEVCVSGQNSKVSWYNHLGITKMILLAECIKYLHSPKVVDSEEDIDEYASDAMHLS